MGVVRGCAQVAKARSCWGVSAVRLGVVWWEGPGRGPEVMD